MLSRHCGETRPSSFSEFLLQKVPKAILYNVGVVRPTYTYRILYYICILIHYDTCV